MPQRMQAPENSLRQSAGRANGGRGQRGSVPRVKAKSDAQQADATRHACGIGEKLPARRTFWFAGVFHDPGREACPLHGFPFS